MTDKQDPSDPTSDDRNEKQTQTPIDHARRRFVSRSTLALGATGLNAIVGPASATSRAKSATLPKTKLRIGFMPLTDSATLVVAAELGVFSRHGLNVELVREASWAAIRDKLAFGLLDAAQMLAAQPLAVELGISPVKEPMQTSFSLDLNGNGVTLARSLCESIESHCPGWLEQSPPTAEPLKREIEARRERREPPLRFAMVSPYSRHNYELRYWLSTAGIDPEHDVSLIVVPPVQMVNQLGERRIDGFCVGEPWNSIAVSSGIGCQAISSYEIWNNGPEKVLATTREFAHQNPQTLRSLHIALLETSQWIDQVENRERVAEIIAQPKYVNVPRSIIATTLNGYYRRARTAAKRQMSDFTVFNRYAANFPWRSHAAWFVTQMYRWGQIEEVINIQSVVESVYRPEPYRQAAAAIGHPYPSIDYKKEGANAAPWILRAANEGIAMGPDQFIDGRTFDPNALTDYIGGFELNHMKVSLTELATRNG